MQFARLFQPRNPLFWIFVLLNGLSTAISYLLRTQEFAFPVALLLAGFVLGNMIYGIRIAMRLMRMPDPSIASTEPRYSDG